MISKNKLFGRNREFTGFLFILPWIIGFLCFQFIPMLSSLFISFTKWDLIGGAPKFVGFRNYIHLFTDDPVFMLALTNTLKFMFISNFIGISLSILLAALLYENIPGKKFFRIVIFLPNLVLPIAFGLMMQPIFGAMDYGLVNIFLGLLKIKPIFWLEKTYIAVWVLIFASLWYIGACTIIFLASIVNQPRSIYEAAELDGAGWWIRFNKITIPLLTPVIFFQVIMGLIYGLQIFDLAAALADMGDNVAISMGKQNCLATLVYYLYNMGFRNFKMGEASAIGWIIFLVGFILTIFIIIFLKRSKSFETGL